MIVGVADTHAAFWLLFGDTRLSRERASLSIRPQPKIKKLLFPQLHWPRLSTSVRKNVYPRDAYVALKEALADPSHVLCESSLTGPVVEAMQAVPRDQMPEMPDRLIAATALYLKVPLITCDERIQSSVARVVW